MGTVVCDIPDKARLILDCVSGRKHSIRLIILVEPFDADLVARGQKCGIEIISMKEVEVRLKCPASEKLIQTVFESKAIMCLTQV